MRATRTHTAILGLTLLGAGCVALPEAPREDGINRVGLPQGWTETERAQFSHQSQGTAMVPYEWFVALEQPQITFVGSVGLFRDPDYLARYGLLRQVAPVDGAGSALRTVRCEPDTSPTLSPADANYNCGLAIGLARARITLPDTGETEDTVGFTCAACHTGELRHDGTVIRVEGASNSIDVTQFQTALGGAMLLTQRLPFRFTRFADRVLRARGLDPESPDYDVERDRLRSAVDAFMTASTPESLTAQRKRLYSNHPGGFGRTDALARIGNMVFGTEMELDDNLTVGSAPVKFPSIWDAPYFSWAQYNGSIEGPMVRNVGESLGVRAKLAYRRGSDEAFTLNSSVDFPGLLAVETLLHGGDDDYFSGLRSPVWPEGLLGEIAWDRAKRGSELYEERCQGCHLPPIADLVTVVPLPSGGNGLGPKGAPVYRIPNDPTSGVVGLESPVPGAGDRQRTYWIANNDPTMLAGLMDSPFDTVRFFLDLPIINLGTIRTDPGQAENFAKTVVDTGDILLPNLSPYKGPEPYPARIIPAGVGLQMVTVPLMEQFFNRVDAFTPAERAEFIRGLPPNLRARDENGGVSEDTPQPGLFLEQGGDVKINRFAWSGYRAPAASANLGYRPHPLNGIWASPPYLHNGSVPNIYELLSPHEERSTVFFTGNREYDLDRIGYQSGRFHGGFRYDTRVTGNSNYGHLFQDGGPGNGIIGPLLTPDDRRAIIEYLKTLCPPGLRTDFDAPGGPTLCQPLPGLSPGR